MDVATTVMLVRGLGLALCVAAFAPKLVGGSDRKRLARRLARAAAPDIAAAPGGRAAVTLRRDVSDSSIKALDQLLKRMVPRLSGVRERLSATGKRISLGEYFLSSALVAVVATLLANRVLGLSFGIAFLCGFGAGAVLPNMALGMMIGRRRSKFLALFPEAIELMVRGLRSGIPLSESIKVVGREIPDPVGVEFRSVTSAMALGQTFDEALTAASARIALPEFRFFMISLTIQQETGGNLAETLDNLATILRKRKQLKLKIKALSSEARASAYILGSLPLLMFFGLNLMSPDYMLVLRDDPRGHVVVAAALGFLATGVTIMIRMGRFPI